MKGSELIVKVLEHLGVDCVFGIPGGANLPLFDAMYHSSIHVVLTRHEQGASHMADGYSRSSNKVGVCMATSGPGATNLITGLATAYMDSIPMIAITGQVQTHMIGSDAFQEADAIGCTRSITKHNYLIMDAKDIVPVLKEAFFIAASGKPGPVHVDIPVDIQKSDVNFDIEQLKQPLEKRSNSNLKISDQSIVDFFDLLKFSRKPLLYVGGGAVSSKISEMLIRFSHRYGIPIVTTLMANGVVDFNDNLYIGTLGMHGQYSANIAVQKCDLLIACGARFDDRITGVVSRFSPYSKKIHLDIDDGNINKIVKVDLHILGDLNDIFSDIIQYNSSIDTDTHHWIKEIETWNQKHPLSYPETVENGFVRPQYVLKRLHHITNGNCILTTGVGQHQMWAMQWYQCKHPKHFLTSGGLGTMGYGLPAAIGAGMCNKDKQIVCIDGDGSFQMMMCELGTMVQENVKVIVIIFNNFYLGMIRQWQELFYQKRFACSELGELAEEQSQEHKYYPDFVKVAESYGICGKRITSEVGLDQVLSDALHSKQSIVFDMIVDPNEKVFPMVPSGHALDEMVLGE